MPIIFKRQCDFCHKDYKGAGEFYCSISCRNKNRTWSDEVKLKIKMSNLGLKRSEKTKERVRIAMTGRKLSKVVRRKMSKSHLGKKHTPEEIAKITLANLGNKNGIGNRGCTLRVGNKNPNWKGGITPVNMKIRKSFEYKQWRTAVFKRDNFTCVWCNSKESGTLNADHIKPFAYFPELRLDINNGRTLCVRCHKKTESYLKNLTKQYAI